MFSVAAIVLLGQTCAKDSDEQFDEEDHYVESMYGQKKEIVQADWKKFMPNAHQLIAISENNLKTIHVKLNGITDGDQKIKWNMACQKGEYEVNDLKRRLERRNLQFLTELKNYDGTSGKTNTDFETTFLREILELNTNLEKTIND